MKDNQNENKLGTIPAAACQFAGGEVSLGDNGEAAKTAPVKIKARSGQPIDHWFWGRVVHDLAGMRLDKPRLTIDYVHNDSEVLGYLNHFDSESGDLIASGAIIPYRDGDRASEVLFKMGEGVPYEASIFFGDSGIKIQEIMSGEISPVNGYDFAGPGVIIREWTLRGVAICPYGADSNTESAALSKGPSFTTTQWTEQDEGENRMSQEATTVDVEAAPEVVETVEAELAVDTEANATEPQEQTATELEEAETEETTTTDEAAEPDATEFEEVSADAVRARLTAVEASQAQAMQEVDTLETELTQVTGERDAGIVELRETTEALTAATTELTELRNRIAAFEHGAPPVSAESAGEASELTPWQKAQKRK